MRATRTNQMGAAEQELHISLVCDEFAASLRAGESQTVDDVCRLHTSLMPMLRPALNAVKALVTLGSFGEPQPGAVIGDFRVERLLARGGMGSVYVAEQLSVGRTVALKILIRNQPAHSGEDAFVVRFNNEVRASAELNHPRIVPIYAVDCVDGYHLYAMQLIDGIDWGEWNVLLSNDAEGDLVSADSAQAAEGQDRADDYAATKELIGERDWKTIATAVRDVSEGLKHAHSCGVIHRDIKPSNLMRDREGNSWIVDFGLARFPAAASMTSSNELVGTLRYMSPEQARLGNARVDERSDIYSLGATFYEMLTGHPLIDADDKWEQLRCAVGGGIYPFRRESRQWPTELETIILKMLAFEAADRYQSAGELIDDLNRLLMLQPVHARRLSLTQKAFRWSRTRAGWLLALAMLLMGVASVLGILTASLLNTRNELRKQLFSSYVAEAQALLLSNHPGQRFTTLQRLDQATAAAAQIQLSDAQLQEVRTLAASALSLRDVESIRRFPRVPGGSLDAAVFSPGLKHFSTYSSPNLHVHSAETGEVLAKLPVASDALTVCFAADNRHVSVLRGPEPEPVLEVWDWTQARLVWSKNAKQFGAVPRRFAIDIGGPHSPCAVGLSNGQTAILDLLNGKVVQTFEGPPVAIGQVQISPFGTWLAATFPEVRQVIVWDLTAENVIAQWTLEDDIFTISWAEDESAIAIGEGSSINVMATRDWTTQIARLSGPNEIIANIYFHPSGRWLTVYGYDGKTRIWDIAAESLVLEVDGHAHYFDDEGHQFGYRTYDGIGVFEVALDDVVWHEASSLVKHLSPHCVTFLNDDKWLAVGGWRGWQLWDVQRRELLLAGKGSQVRDAAWSVDGQSLFFASEQGLFKFELPLLQSAVQGSAEVATLDLREAEEYQIKLPNNEEPSRIAVSNDAQDILVTTRSGGVGWLSNLADWEWLHQPGSNFRYAAISNDGLWAAASQADHPLTTVWKKLVHGSRESLNNTARAQRYLSWSIDALEGGDVSLAYRDGQVDLPLLLTSEQNKYRLWSLGNSGPVHIKDIRRPSGYQYSVTAFCPNLGWVLAIDRSEVGVNDPTSGRTLLNLVDRYQTDRAFDIRPDSRGNRIAVAISDQGFYVWDIESVVNQLGQLDAGN